jgi:hypothetical protein
MMMMIAIDGVCFINDTSLLDLLRGDKVSMRSNQLMEWSVLLVEPSDLEYDILNTIDQ